MFYRRCKAELSARYHHIMLVQYVPLGILTLHSIDVYSKSYLSSAVKMYAIQSDQSKMGRTELAYIYLFHAQRINWFWGQENMRWCWTTKDFLYVSKKDFRLPTFSQFTKPFSAIACYGMVKHFTYHVKNISSGKVKKKISWGTQKKGWGNSE